MKRYLIAIVGLALALVGCGELLEPAAATVGNSKITIEDVEAALEAFRSGIGFEEASKQASGAQLQKRFERGYLQRRIRLLVFQSRAKEFGVEVTDAEVKEQIDQIKAQFPTEKDLEIRAAQEAIGVGDLDDLVELSLLEERLRAKVTEGLGPTEEELRGLYSENITQFTQGFHTAHILVEDRGQAVKIARQLHMAPRRKVVDLFGKLANKFSIDNANARKGGDLGTVSVGQFAPEFESAALALNKGEISDPVQTQFGFHIIRLIEKDVVPFEQAREQLLQQFPGDRAEQAWNEWVVDAYESAEVDVNPRYGEFDLQTQTIRAPGPADIPGGATPTGSPSPSPATPAP